MAKGTFTDDDQKQLNELIARRDAAAQAQAAADREAQQKAYKALDPLFAAIDMSKIDPALTDSLAADGLSSEDRNRLMRIQQILTFDYKNGLLATRNVLNPPEPVPEPK